MVVQWTVIILTIAVLLLAHKGRSTYEKQMGMSFLTMTFVLNVGYLFELMSDNKANIFMSLEIEAAGLIFMGYFLCLFFCYYTKDYTPRWIAVYTLVYDMIMLVIVWTSRWHELIFKNVRYELSESGYELFYEHGEMYLFAGLGSGLLPVVTAVVLIITYIGKERDARLRKQILLVALMLFGSYTMSVLFFIRAFPFSYQIAASAGMLIADFFVLRLWGKERFHPATAAVEMAFDNLDEGVIILDPSLELMSYNAAAKRSFPELEPELIRHNIKRLRSLPLELFEEYEKKEIDVGSHHYEVTRTKVTDLRNTIRGYVLIINDQTLECNYITEISNGRKKAQIAEQEALQALSEAKKATRAKADFLTNISHEIRTPMNAIVGLAELISEESRGRKVYDFACDIKNASINLMAVINDIVSLSRLETGQVTLEEDEYGTEQLLEETLHLSKVAASSKGLQLKRDISKKLPCRLIGDELRVRQVLSSLLTFGIKNTQRGYVKLTATHKWLDEKQILLIFQFEDTGDGFTPEEIEGLFQQFQGIDRAPEGGLESIGLGIAITKRVVDLMNGTLEMSSEPGKGTVVTVCLPQKVADIRCMEQQPWRKHDVSFDIDRAFIVPEYRVLVVDDNKINLKVACGALAPYKFHIDEAKSGQQAIDLVKRNVYDMIFMDHMMPEMDGIEATDHIRNECGENGRSPIIIALSANAYNHARDMFVDNGFQDFIAKPLDKNELHEMLCKWIPKELRQSVEGTPEAEAKIARAEAAEFYIAGVDVASAMAMHSGNEADYLELLELYYMDGKEKTELLERLVKEEDFKNYEIEVHGLKSASANIGAGEFSELAKKHEFAAKDGNYDLIKADVARLLSEYQFLLREIERVLRNKGYLKEETEGSTNEEEALPEEETRRRMEEILDDIENFLSKPAARKVEELLSENIEKSAKDCLKDVRNRLKMYDDDTAEELLRVFLEK